MNSKVKNQIGLVVVVALIIGAITYLEWGQVDPIAEVGNQDVVVAEQGSDRTTEKAQKYELGKEISTPDGFINIDEIGVGELIGKKVILVDFWTYSCINCQRTLPYLNDWHEKYSEEGLVILGIHTPEFEFEKDFENVKKAVEKWDVKYPVILDNDFSTWRSYKNRYWPRKYLIDIDGYIVYDHIGEGGYAETEAKIVELLNEKNELLGMEMLELSMDGPENVDAVDFGKVRSPETYLGSSRVEHLANIPDTTCAGLDCEYVSEGEPTLNTFELTGTWNIQPEAAVLNGEEGSVFIRFSANKVHLVAQSDEGVSAEVYLDGKKVDEFAGYSVEGGVVLFKESDLYNLIDLKGNYGEHLLEVRFLEPGVEAFAFTFG